MNENPTVVKVKSGIKTLKVEWEKSSFLKKKYDLFTFNIGDKDAITRWYEKAKTLDNVDKFKEATLLNELYEIEYELVTMILGKKSWKKIWKRSGHNVFAVLQILQVLSGIVKEGIEESIKMIQDEKSNN